MDLPDKDGSDGGGRLQCEAGMVLLNEDRTDGGHLL